MKTKLCFLILWNFLYASCEKNIIPFPPMTSNSKTDPAALLTVSKNEAPLVGTWMNNELEINIKEIKLKGTLPVLKSELFNFYRPDQWFSLKNSLVYSDNEFHLFSIDTSHCTYQYLAKDDQNYPLSDELQWQRLSAEDLLRFLPFINLEFSTSKKTIQLSELVVDQQDQKLIIKAEELEKLNLFPGENIHLKIQSPYQQDYYGFYQVTGPLELAIRRPAYMGEHIFRKTLECQVLPSWLAEPFFVFAYFYRVNPEHKAQFLITPQKGSLAEYFKKNIHEYEGGEAGLWPIEDLKNIIKPFEKSFLLSEQKIDWDLKLIIEN